MRRLEADADKLMIGILWGLMALSVALAPWHGTWTWVVFVGLPTAIAPTVLATVASGKLVTRLFVAAAFMIFAALNIYQANGMTEMHFGIFVLLASLLCYRDWRPIVLATFLIVLHHLSFNYLQELGYGVMCFTHPGLPIVLTHAAYLLIDAVALSYLSLILKRQGVRAAELEPLVESMHGKRLDKSPAHV